MAESTAAAGHIATGPLDLPLSFATSGDGEGGTTMDRIAAVWNLDLPPEEKLAALYIASSGLRENIMPLAIWMGRSERVARVRVNALRRAGVFA